jgi:CRISPR system Cascade subunit CasE
MYLSQLVLDLMDKKTMRALSDLYILHQFVMMGFSDYDQSPRVLFRVEPDVKGSAVKILVQSEVQPSWRVENAENSRNIRVQVKEFEPAFRNGFAYRFRLRANPVVTKDGKRRGLIRDEALIEWLKNREERLGAAIRSVVAVDEGYSTGLRKKGKQTDRINIKLVRFEGVLEVEDSDLLTESVRNGIGPAKGFGCGLLSLARV